MPQPTLSLGDFDLDRPVGRGGMAEVWLGHHRTLKRPAALKVMRGAMAGDAGFVAGFHREVRAVAGLDHPGIVGVFDTGLVDQAAADASGGALTVGGPWLAMEYAAGGDLSDTPGPLPWGRLHGLLLEILDALAHAHARGVIHRDLKPANILARGADGGRRLMLTDFGIAHVVEPQLASDAVGATSSGTPHYMAPEQIRGHWRDYGPWTDLYALGCMAFELACGQLPFDGRSAVAIAMQHVSAPVPPLGETRGTPASFEAWVRRLLAKAPQDRFETAADAAWQLARMPAPKGMVRIHPSGGPRYAPAADTLPRLPDRAMTTLAVLVDTALLDAVLAGHGDAEALALRATSHAPDLSAAIAAGSASAAEATRAEHPVPPMPASWRLPDGAEAPRRALGTGLFAVRDTPFVGRVAERDALWDALRTVRRTGTTRMVLIEGPAGCGKSRLADWLARRAEEVGSGIAVRAAHGPVPSPLDGVLSAMRSWFRGDELERPALKARIEERLHRLLPFLPAAGLAEAAEGLAALLDPDPQAPGRPGNPAERRATIAHWLRQATDRRPLLLCIDNAHFGLDALALAEQLLRDTRQTPILVLATISPERLAERRMESELRDRLAARDDVTTLRLGPLPAVEHAALVRTLLQLDPALVDAVCAGTGGEPWFAEQVVADWIDQGILEPGPAGYRADEAEVAPDVDTLVQRRLTRFVEARRDPRRTWGALTAAAALGSTVARGEWRRVCAVRGSPPPGPLEGALTDRGWIREVPGGWMFTDEAWRRALVHRAREDGSWAALNQACARVLRAAVPSAVGWARIARHHAEAGEPVASLTAGVEAAAALLEVGDYHRVHDLVATVAAQADAAGLAAHHPTRARALWLDADACRYLARFDDAAAILDRLAGFPLPEAQAELCRIRAGVVHMWGDLAGARALYAEAVERYAALGHTLGEVRSRHGSAWVQITEGRFAEAGQTFARAAELARAHGHTLDEAWCRHGVASSLIFQGLPGAGAPARSALATFTRHGARAGVAATRMFVGEALGFEGRYAEARSWFDSAIELWQALGSNFTALGWIGLGLMCLDAGRDDEAAHAVEQAGRGGVPPAFSVLFRVGQGLVAARAGDVGPWSDAVRGSRGAMMTPPRLRRHLAELAERSEAAGALDVARATWSRAALAWQTLDPAEAARCAARAAALPPPSDPEAI